LGQNPGRIGVHSFSTCYFGFPAAAITPGAAVNHVDDPVATAVPETISPILRSMTSPHAFAEEWRPIGGQVFRLELDHSMVRPAHPGLSSNPPIDVGQIRKAEAG